MLEFKHAEMKMQSFRGVREKGSLGLLPVDVMMSEVTSLLDISALTSVKWESLGPRMWLRRMLAQRVQQGLTDKLTMVVSTPNTGSQRWRWEGSEVQGHP